MVIRRESISKTAFDTKGLLYWFESLRGRGNIRPTTSVIEFTQIINKYDFEFFFFLSNFHFLFHDSDGL